MPFELGGKFYMTSAEVLDDIKISRQTLWRWRREGKIPIGKRFRDGKILFDVDEVTLIREYANRIDLDYIGHHPMQLKLFK